MVLLSFSVKKDELLAGTKIRTTRLYTEQKWKLWQETIPPYATRFLDGWWKPRTKNGYQMFERRGADLYRLQFHHHNGYGWPCWEREPMSEDFRPMNYEQSQRWAKEEGFENDLKGLLRFFENGYELTESLIFQSIAFPPIKGVE
jgi:hypothetical protein